jgi:tellurite resistance protein TerC
MPSPPVATDLAVSAGTWAILGVLVVALLAIDLVLFGRGRREVTLRESIAWSVLWVVLAVGFGGVVWAWQGGDAGSEYLAGYLLERSLSLDNIFVFAIIFSYFAVPIAVQPRVLGWGIGLALVLRLVFILLGAALLDAFHATFYAFGALLLYTAYKLARHDDSEIEPEHNPALRILRRRVPMTADYHGHHLTVRDAGKRLATPLAAVFIVVATTDIVFAVDSIPAIFAVTQEPFIVFTSNAFAILGLRSLYFAIAGLMMMFKYIKVSLIFILGFVGVKMILHHHVEISHAISLGVIVGFLAVGVLASLWSTRREQRAQQQ